MLFFRKISEGVLLVADERARPPRPHKAVCVCLSLEQTSKQSNLADRGKKFLFATELELAVPTNGASPARHRIPAVSAPGSITSSTFFVSAVGPKRFVCFCLDQEPNVLQVSLHESLYSRYIPF
jgi:hypothetical protein